MAIFENLTRSFLTMQGENGVESEKQSLLEGFVVFF